MSLANTAEQEAFDEYQPTRKEHDDISYAIAFRDECLRQTQEERTRWRRSLERYNLSRNISRYDYIKDVHIGLTYDAVERISSALPGREFGFTARPVGPEDTRNALLFSESLSRVWNAVDGMDGPSKMNIVKRSMALFGSCPVQLYWDVKTDSTGVVTKSDPGFYPLNIFNFYANKFATDIEECDEVGYVSEMSIDTFKNQAKVYGYKNWKKVKGIAPQDPNDKTQAKQGGDKIRTVQVFEVQSNDFILTIALDKQPVWLRKVPNQLGVKNCVMFRYKRSPVPNRLYGVTDIERGGELEDSIQEAFNQMAFNHLLVDNPMYSYNKLDRNIDPRTFVAAPAAGIPRGADPNALTPVQFDSHLGESINIIGNMMERYKRIVNNPDILAGVGDKNVDSATESNIIDANTKATFESVVDEMKSTMYKVAKLIRRMYIIYGPDSITIKVYSPELLQKIGTPAEARDGMTVEMDKGDFVLDRDIDVVVDYTTQNKSTISRNLVNFLQITAKDTVVPPNLRLLAYQQWLQMNDLNELALAYDSMVNKQQTSDTALADQENQQMANGTQLPPTPGATTAHTQRHVEFMRSNETGPEIDRLLDVHIKGEIAGMQNAAEGGSPSQEGGEAPEAAPIQAEGNTMTQ